MKEFISADELCPDLLLLKETPTLNPCGPSVPMGGEVPPHAGGFAEAHPRDGPLSGTNSPAGEINLPET